jgi:methyl-accepting chemotaxis protein
MEEVKNEEKELGIERNIGAKIKEAIIFSFIFSLGLIVSVGTIVGVMITLIRFNWWKFINPFLAKTLPPVLVLYISIFAIYLVVLWIRSKDIENDLASKIKNGISSEKDLMEVSQKISSFAQFAFISSILAWIVCAILTPISLYLQDISDLQTIIVYVFSVISLSLLSSFTIATIIGNTLSHEIKISKTAVEVLSRARIPIRIKILAGVTSVMLLFVSIFFIFHIEKSIKDLKEKEARELYNIFSKGEEIPYGVKWQITKDKPDNNIPFEKEIIEAIEEKTKLKEGILFDYISPSLFIFREKDDKTIYGQLIPLPWVEDKIKSDIIPFFIVAIILGVLSSFFINITIGKYISRAISESEKGIIPTDDEFFRVSSVISKQSYQIEDVSNKYAKIYDETQKAILHIYSSLIDTKTGIHKIQEETRRLKTSVGKISQLTSKEIEIEDISTEYSIESIYQKINSAAKEVKKIRDRVNELLSQITEISVVRTSSTSPTHKDIYYDERTSVKEVMLSKKIEFAKSNLERIDEFLERLKEKIAQFSGIVEKISVDMDKFSSLREDIDGLRKRLVILSMNTTIIAVRNEGQTKEELSIIAKQMSETIDEIKKIENRVKELTSIAKRIENEYLNFSQDGTIKDILSDISGMIAGVKDTIEEDIISLAYDIARSSSDTRSAMKHLLSRISEMDEFTKKLSNLVSKVESEKHEIISSFEIVLREIENLSSISKEVEEKCEKILSSFEMLVEKYKSIKREFKNILNSIRLENQKILETVEKIEQENNDIKNSLEKTLKFIAELLQQQG